MEMAQLMFPDAVQILDWFHLSERVHETATAIYRQGTAQASQLTQARLGELWKSQSSQTLVPLREMRKQLRPSAVAKRCGH